jgi:hypothetical protein
MRDRINTACVVACRDPATLARSAGVLVELPDVTPYPSGFPAWNYPPLRGTTEQLAEHFHAFARAGYDGLQVWANPPTVAGIERLAEVLTILDRG